MFKLSDENRLIAYTPPEEQVVVDRLLSKLHLSVDQNFPNAPSSKNRKFAKTIYIDENSSSEDNVEIDELTSALSDGQYTSDRNMHGPNDIFTSKKRRILATVFVIMLVVLSYLASGN